MTSEAKKIYMKKWREENKAKIAERDKKYRKDNKEKIAEKNKKYNQENKEKLDEYNKKYREENKTAIAEKDKKCYRISNWKRSGVINDDFDALYDYYLIVDNCEECNIELVEVGAGTNKKCLDHNHTTGLFRDILCNGCNIKRG